MKGVNTILPKRISVSVSFNVIHEHTLGWDSNKTFGEGYDTFPYGVRTEVIDYKNANLFSTLGGTDATASEAWGQASQDEAEGLLDAIRILRSPVPDLTPQE